MLRQGKPERWFSGDGKSRVSMNMNVQLEMPSGHERRGAEREPCEGVVYLCKWCLKILIVLNGLEGYLNPFLM